MPGFELGFVIIGLALAGAGFFFWKKQKARRDRDKQSVGPPAGQTATGVAAPPAAGRVRACKCGFVKLSKW